MTVPYRTFLALGSAVGLLAVGYIFAPEPGAAGPPAAGVAKDTPAAAPALASTERPAAIAAKSVSTLAANRAPVPLAPRTHDTYYTPKQADPSLQTASATPAVAVSGTTATDGSTPPPLPDSKGSAGGAQAKAAIELDGYKNVRALEQGPDGIWRGRAMRGRTEITVRVDATGSVSAE